jgi:hypothetical protein
MTLLPARFLVRFALPCPYVAKMPLGGKDRVIDLPENARLQAVPALDGVSEFADVRLAWNETGIGVQVSVSGKSHEPVGDRDRPRSSDGLTLWLDTRDNRTSHRANRFCHQFHLLAAGGGPERSAPVFVQSKINRALEDAPLGSATAVPFRGYSLRGGYRLEAFLSTAILNGFDPDQHPRLGVYCTVRDAELGDQYLTVNQDFPFADDPSLWQVLELVT